MIASLELAAPTTTSGWCRSLLLAATLLVAMTCAAETGGEPTRRALLVGVGDYPGLPRDKQLQGPANDVREMRNVLTRNWGFAASDIRSLVDRQATHAAIIAELEALIGAANAGDVILIYFSGHGTSGRDPANALVKQDLSDTGAFFPHDADVASEPRALASLLIGRRDLRPRLARLDQTGASVYVIADACFSGSLVRSALSGVPVRQAAIPGGIRMPPRRRPDQVSARPVVGDDELESPYRNVLFLSAVGTGEPAIDVTKNFLSVYPTLSGDPQGAFTDALVRVLSGKVWADTNRDRQMSFSELARATETQLRSVKIPYQPRTIPGSRSPGYAIAQRSLFSSSALPQANPSAPSPRPRAEPARTTRVKLGASVHSNVADTLRTIGSGRVELVASRGDLVVSVADGKAYICDGIGDAIAILGNFDDERSADRARLANSVVARSIYRTIVERARAQSDFAVKLDLADSNLTAVHECTRAEQRQIATDSASADVTTRCAFNIGAHLEQPARLLTLNFDPAGNFYRIYPGAGAGGGVAAGTSHQLISTFVETSADALGVEMVLALALPSRGDPTDLAVFEQRVPAENAEATLLDILQRSGTSFGAAELEIPVIPLGSGKRPGLGACADDL